MTLPKRSKRQCKGFTQGVCIWFDPRTVEGIDRMAAAHGMSRSEWVRRTLVQALGGTVEVPPEGAGSSVRASSPKGHQLALPLPTKTPRRSR